MFSVNVIDNSARFTERIQERMLFNCRAAAEGFRGAVKATLATDAFDPKEHAIKGNPPLRHTGDLQSSIHYAGGIDVSTGDIIFLVFPIAWYGHELAWTHPFIDNVFQLMFTQIIDVMSAPLGRARSNLSPSSFAISTQSYTGAVYVHNYYEVFPSLPMVTRAYYTF